MLGSTFLRLLIVTSSTFALLSCTPCKQKTNNTTDNTDRSGRKTNEPKDDPSKFFYQPPKRTLAESIARYLPEARGKSELTGVQLKKAADTALSQKDYESAESILNELIKLEPRNGTAYHLRGKARCNGVHFNDQAALEDLKMAIKLNQDIPTTYGFMAQIYDASKDNAKSIEILSQGIAKFPREEDLRQARAVQYLEQGRKKEAKADYDGILEIDPKDAYIYLVRGQLNESFKDYDSALNDYQNAIKYEKKDVTIPKKILAYKARANLFSKMGKHKQAIEELTRALTVDKTDEEAFRFRGQTYEALSMYDRALADYTTSIDLAPQFAAASYEARSRVYQRIGKFDLAEKDRAKATKMRKAPAELPVY